MLKIRKEELRVISYIRSLKIKLKKSIKTEHNLLIVF